MRVETKHNQGPFEIADSFLGDKADLVFYFGQREKIECGSVYESLKKTYPNSIILGGSTCGEIFSQDVFDESIISVAIDFEKTSIKHTSAFVQDFPNSFDLGIHIANTLKSDDLRGVFILSDGLMVNGSLLVHGMEKALGKNIPILGGLAGDGENFKTTLVGINKTPSSGQVGAIGFYGDHIHLCHGSAGGWDPHGPERTITKSTGNILYEIDGKPATDFYRKHLGRLADDQKNALFYPFSLWPGDQKETAFIRSVITLNEEDKSITFTGDIPEGYTAQLMRGLVPKLLDGAYDAGKQVQESLPDKESVAILISCMGRRLVLGHHTYDEISSVSEALNHPKCHQIGFYSYGEISPRRATNIPELHNQTMTIASFYED